MLEYYVEEYARRGFHGTCEYDVAPHDPTHNDSELVPQPRGQSPGRAHASGTRASSVEMLTASSLTKSNIDIPVLLIQASKDSALPPSMANGMGKYIPNLTKVEVNASHWALWQAAEAVNDLIETWLTSTKVAMGKSTL